MSDSADITQKPILFDLFCGRGGWSTAAAARGWRCVGFDIADHGYTAGELILLELADWIIDSFERLRLAREVA